MASTATPIRPAAVLHHRLLPCSRRPGRWDRSGWLRRRDRLRSRGPRLAVAPAVDRPATAPAHPVRRTFRRDPALLYRLQPSPHRRRDQNVDKPPQRSCEGNGGGRKADAGMSRRSYGCRVPDAIFAHPRLAPVYDAFEGDRDDLAAYVGIAGELGAERVLDVGCGTGCLAVLLADSGQTVMGADPAGASLAVARAKDVRARITWFHGDATALPPFGADLAVMTGNVAPVSYTHLTLPTKA